MPYLLVPVHTFLTSCSLDSLLAIKPPYISMKLYSLLADFKILKNLKISIVLGSEYLMQMKNYPSDNTVHHIPKI